MTYPPPPGPPHDPQQPDPYRQQYPGYSPQPSDPYQSSPPPSDPYQSSPPPSDPYQQQPGYGVPPQQPGAAPQPGFPPPPQQYGPGVGGYPPPGGQPSMSQKLQSMPPKQLGKIAGIGGGGLLLIIILIIVLASGGGPDSVVDDYMSAVKDMDIEESASYLCDADDDMFTAEDLDDPEMREEAEKFVEDLDWEILDTHVAGDEATVELKIISSTEFLSGTFDLALEKREGDWFICSVG